MIRNKTLLILCLALTSQVHGFSFTRTTPVDLMAVASPTVLKDHLKTYKGLELLWLIAPAALFISGTLLFEPFLAKHFFADAPASIQKFVKDIGAELGIDRNKISVKCTSWASGGGMKSGGNGIIFINPEQAAILANALREHPNSDFIRAMRIAVRHEFGHDQERHKLILAAVALSMPLSFLISGKMLAKTRFAPQLTSPATLLDIAKNNLMLNARGFLSTILPLVCFMTPCSRYIESRADRYAANHTHDPVELDTMAKALEIGAAAAHIERGSFLDRFADPFHQPIFERIDLWRNAVRRRIQEEENRMQQAERA